eukprot:6188324-Pleurochrysis_carterae.AAC.1
MEVFDYFAVVKEPPKPILDSYFALKRGWPRSPRGNGKVIVSGELAVISGCLSPSPDYPCSEIDCGLYALRCKN